MLKRRNLFMFVILLMVAVPAFAQGGLIESLALYTLVIIFAKVV
jgi:hypothetical protein